MNLIPESNGFKKVNMKKKISHVGWLKRISMLIAGIFIFGLIFQVITYFIGNGKLSSSLDYTKVNGNKMEYKYKGSGDYTIVFDGAIGTTLYQWDEISDRINKELNAKTFVYNRKGYGFSDIATDRTPKEQAMDLKILLRKAGVSGKLILVGEEYGSLIMTNFAKEYPDSVSAMILINPYSEEEVKTEEYKKKIKKLYNKMKEVLKLREKTILELRFGLNGDKPKTQSEIAQMMGISRSYVSRIETKAIGKLAQEIIEE